MEKLSLFRREAVLHRRGRLHGDVIIVQPPAMWMIASLLSAIVLALVAFLVWGEYARKETVAGYLSPGPGVVKVYSPQLGLVGQVLVEDGSYIEKGAPLFSVEARRYEASVEGDVETAMLATLERQASEIERQLAQQQTFLAMQAPYYKGVISLLTEEIGALESQLSEQRELVSLAEEDMAAGRQLERKGFASRKQSRKIEEQRLLQRQRLYTLEEQLASRHNLLLRTEFESEQSPLLIADRMSELKRAESDIHQRAMDLSAKRTTVVRAPVSGYVSFLQVSPGKAVTSDLPLLSIVPSGSALVAELYVPSRAIGFVEAGQDVKLLFDAFPYERFGAYKGNIAQVARTVLSKSEIPSPIESDEPVYRVVVELAQQHAMAYGKPVPLQPGMALKADIIFDKRALYEWALEPFYAVRGRML